MSTPRRCWRCMRDGNNMETCWLKEFDELEACSLDAQIITATQMPKVLADWRKPRHEAFEPRTAWSLFNCYTEVLKSQSLFRLAPRTQALHALLDQFAGVNIQNN